MRERVKGGEALEGVINNIRVPLSTFFLCFIYLGHVFNKAPKKCTHFVGTLMPETKLFALHSARIEIFSS